MIRVDDGPNVKPINCNLPSRPRRESRFPWLVGPPIVGIDSLVWG